MPAGRGDAPHGEDGVDGVLPAQQGARRRRGGIPAVGVLHIEDAVGQVGVADGPGHVRGGKVMIVRLAEGRGHPGAAQVDRAVGPGAADEDAALEVALAGGEMVAGPPVGVDQADHRGVGRGDQTGRGEQGQPGHGGGEIAFHGRAPDHCG